MNHDEIDANNWRDKNNIWLPYVKMDYFWWCYARNH